MDMAALKFQCSLKASTVGAAWLERGGVFVFANIRGGGEFGPNGIEQL
jgi:prolyl oligopeptidase PreP (S9A serine peptidase family)